MPDYQRACHQSVTCFFAINLLQIAGNEVLISHAGIMHSMRRNARWLLRPAISNLTMNIRQ
jgi:hypothetical protein